MLKIKYLHRKGRKSLSTQTWETKKYKRPNIDLLSDDAPMYMPIKRKYQWSNYDVTPLIEFIKSKIGQNWNDVYSEILTKIKKKYRHDIDDSITYIVKPAIYDEDFIPRDYKGRVLNNVIFTDMNNILVKKTKDENISDAKKYAKKYVRREKLKIILENINNENNEA